MEPLLQMTGLTRHFGPVRAIDGLDLALHPGELVAISGPDGAGKSTLTGLAAGVLAPTNGRVEPDSRGRVGYLTGRFSLYPELTVWENLTFFAQIYGMNRATIDTEARRLLDWVGLLPFRERLSGVLSGGMRQKLALACALIHKPPVLILDEPTTAVDPLARADFWSLLRQQAAEGRAILVTTPYLDEAELGHRTGLLHQGHLLAIGPADELKRRLPYRMAWLTLVGDGRLDRGAAKAAAEGLPGHRWSQSMGTGIRIALDPESPLEPPTGYSLVQVEANLEDLYLWLSDQQGVSAP